MPAKIPAMFASTKGVSNFGTMFVAGGGKEAKAATAFLDWKTKGDQNKRSWFCQPSEKTMSPARQTDSITPLSKDGWTIDTKNGMC
jgi:hypothetical protein